jgi:hypothetical protein
MVVQPEESLCTPVALKMSSMRHHFVKDDWKRFTPTKEVNRNHHGLTHQPKASVARMKLPAIVRIF